MEPAYPGMELWAGVSIHGGMAELLVSANPTSQDVDSIATRARNNYLAAYDEASPHPEHQELSWLVYGLVYTWGRLLLPEFLNEYEVLGVETELALDITPIIKLQGRPDAILRHKLTKDYYVLNFKSSGYINSDSWARRFETDQQLSSELLLVEKQVGAKCAGVIIEGMYTGSKRESKDEAGNSYSYRSSPLLYGWYRSPNPPVSTEAYEWKYERARGKQWQRIKTWGTEAGVKNWVEYWLQVEPQMLRDQFKRLPPIKRDVDVVEDWLMQSVEQVSEMEMDRGILANDYMKNPVTYRQYLNVLFPQHTQECDRYTRGCEFKQVCWANKGVEPLTLGMFKPRTPNHPLIGGE